MGDFKKALGERIRKLRTEKGLSLEQVGESIGMTKSALSKVERGEVSVSFENLFGIAKVLGVSLDTLAGSEPKDTGEYFFNQNWEKNYHFQQTKNERKSIQSLLELASSLDDSDVEMLTLFANRLKGSSFSEHFEEPILLKPTKKRPPFMDKGLVIREKNLPNHYFVSIPLIGQVSAGLPVTAVENVEDILEIPADYLPGTGTFFALRVKGDSMVNVGIHDGELVIVRQESTAENGDIVVAMTNDEDATVKTFYKENGHIRLQPENDYMEPIIVPNVRILGKVVSVYKYAGKR
ncbi:transcriptional repressor LexA [Brevibacillus borstelensis]|uniref:transcriptional repressor LexA n=1 Tax=Brevibacillus borstelensis TaxID=45462 RepID=UPI002E241E29|nr:transcriptional repressor LexA [Brevibacillus borstelensis]MED1851865.1 transcriptional repressor LexA [Brevibacillus borstelensis]